MLINADFNRSAHCDTRQAAWIDSPQGGVQRIALDRLGEEVARATSLVRYAPGSRFPLHVHGGGEEILVLDGVFSDAQGDYPAGSYLRNPPLSQHAPWSQPGCTLLVKLWQFQPGDEQTVRILAEQQHWQGLPDGRQCCTLHHFAAEVVTLEQWPAGFSAQEPCAGGLELLVLDGELAADGQHWAAGSWLRLPAGHTLHWHSHGARLWLKRGHLSAPDCWALRGAQA